MRKVFSTSVSGLSKIFSITATRRPNAQTSTRVLSWSSLKKMLLVYCGPLRRKVALLLAPAFRSLSVGSVTVEICSEREQRDSGGRHPGVPVSFGRLSPSSPPTPSPPLRTVIPKSVNFNDCTSPKQFGEPSKKGESGVERQTRMLWQLMSRWT